MKDLEVEQLLRLADAPPPELPDGLATRVRARDRRGRRARAGVAAGCVAAAAVALGFVVARRGDGKSPGESPTVVVVADDKSALEALTREVERRRREIDGLLAGERLKVLEKRLRESEALAPAARGPLADRERGAGALMVYAGELSRHGGAGGAAGREYRRVIELFPDSPLAAVARANLEKVEQ